MKYNQYQNAVAICPALKYRATRYLLAPCFNTGRALFRLIIIGVMALFSAPNVFAQQAGEPASNEFIMVNCGITATSTFSNTLTLTVGQPMITNLGESSLGNSSALGFWSRLKLPPHAPFVYATDGVFPDKVVVSWAEDALSPSGQDGFKLFREDDLLGTFGFNVDEYQDFNILAGQFYQYDVLAINQYGEGPTGDDIGFVNPNGTITGRVETQNGRAVPNTDVGLTPLIGNALDFDGVDDYVELPPGSFPLGVGTIEYWYQYAQNDGNIHIYLSNREDNGFGGGPALLEIHSSFSNAGGRPYFVYQDGAPTVSVAEYTTTLVEGDWYHMAVSYDTTATLDMYINGELTASANMAGSNFAGYTPDRCYIGRPGAPMRWGKGVIDEVRFWDDVRTIAEIQEYMGRSLSGNEAGLLANYTFNEGLSDIAFDLTDNDYDGKIHGPAWTDDIAEVYYVGTTNSQGNYEINGINYGSGTTFTATPSKVTPINSTSLVFDPADSSYASVDYDARLNPTTFTVELWAKVAGSSGEWRTAVMSRAGGGAYQGYTIYAGSNNKWQFWTGDEIFWQVLTGPDIELNTWVHLAAVYDATTDIKSFYVNGQLADSSAAQGYVPNVEEAPFTFGAANTGDNYFFDGQLDEVRLWETARSQTNIQSTMNNILTGEEDGLAAYWQCNEGYGTALSDSRVDDLTDPLTGFLVNADPVTAWSEDSPNPEFVNHEYLPESRVVTLTPSNTAVNDVGFIDMTQVKVTGYVQYANTNCFADSVEILVDGLSYDPAIYTDNDGYFLGEFEPGTSHRLTPRYRDHAFNPAFWDVANLTAPVAGILFEDQEIRTLWVNVYGGPDESCQHSLTDGIAGDADIEITIRTADDCLNQTQSISDGGTFTTFYNLPPLGYLIIEVEHDGLIAMGEGFNGQTVTLRDSSSTFIDFNYQPSISVTMTPSWSDPPDSCPNYTSPDNEPLTALPKLQQFTTQSINLSIIEDYSDFYDSGLHTCSVDTGFVTVYNNIADAADTSVAFSNGQLNNYSFTVGNPNLLSGGDNPYQKSIQATARELVLDSNGQYINGRSASVSEWVYVWGHRERDGFFLTVTGGREDITWILRNPPGDGSFSTIMQDSTYSVTKSYSYWDGEQYQQIGFLSLGPEIDSGISMGVGAEAIAEGSANAIAEWATETTITYEHINTTEVEVSLSSGFSFSTSGEAWDEELLPGDESDVFVGLGQNFTLAKTDYLSFDGCAINITESIAITEINNVTLYFYSRFHLENYLIPGLEEISQAYADSFATSGDPYYETLADSFHTQALNWHDVTDKDSTLKAGAEYVRSIAFDGAAGSYEYYETVSSSKSVINEYFIQEDQSNEVSLGVFLLGVGGYATGGFASWTGGSNYMNTETQAGENLDFIIDMMGGIYDPSLVEDGDTTNVVINTIETTWGFSLSDDDAGDYFWIDVYEDDWSGSSPVFVLQGGASMCPWEENTAKREGVSLTTDSNSALDLPPDQLAIFNIDIGNLSETEEVMVYELVFLHESNPDGALIKINGIPVSDPFYYMIEPNQVLEAVMTVEPGPQVWEHYGLTLRLQSICEGERANALGIDPQVHMDQFFDVTFLGPCSGVSINNLDDPWMVLPEDNDTLWVSLSGYNLTSSDFMQIRLQYQESSLINILNKNGGSGENDVQGLSIDNPFRESYEYNSVTQGVEPISAKNDAAIFDKNATSVIRQTGIRSEKASLKVDQSNANNGPANRGGSDDEGDGIRATWIDIEVIPRDSLNAIYTFVPWDVSPLTDGPYEVRAITECINGDSPTASSGAFVGIIERYGPSLMGNPSPVDHILDATDQIEFTFSEFIDCDALDPVLNMALIDVETGDDVPLTFSCQIPGRSIVIEPAVDNAEIENRTLQASVTGVADYFGNVMDGTETWEFYVNRNPVSWINTNIVVTKYEDEIVTFSAPLRNEGGTMIGYNLRESLPGWLTAFPDSGGLVPGAIQMIQFVVSDELAGGVYQHQVLAHTSMGDETLTLDISVSCRPPNWSVNPAEFQHSMTLIAEVNFGSAVPIDTSQVVVGAFIDDSPRGMAPVTYSDAFGKYLAFLTVLSDSAATDSLDNELVSFRVWDGLACQELGQHLDAFTFQVNSHQGDGLNPYVIVLTQNVIQEISLFSGWTWISLNVHRADMSTNSILGALNATNSDLIKTQTKYSQFVSGVGWIGQLDSLGNQSMYMLTLQNAADVEIIGSSVDLATNSIPLQAGWNWIAYQPNVTQPVVDALASLNPNSGDIIKNQYGFAYYMDGYSWVGSLIQMEPSQGYKINLATADTLTYTITPAACITGLDGNLGHFAVEPIAWAQPTSSLWIVNSSQFEHNMTITGAIDSPIGGDQEEFIIGAFVGDECRGIAELVYIPNLDQRLFFLMVNSNSTTGEQINFKMLRADDEFVYEANEQLEFQSNGMVGNIESPFVWTTDQALAVGEPETEALPTVFSLSQNFPNPFNPTTTIHYALPVDSQVEIVIYNAVGQLVKTLVSGQQDAGYQQVVWSAKNDAGERVHSGVYFYRMTADSGFEETRKLLLLK
ncbi:MAG: T9SS type A sorting domain-containing protein [Planctomycetes bacterium]|nr:T9SS type A sorting domain-containing protein [Planctomycetota bacterium]